LKPASINGWALKREAGRASSATGYLPRLRR